LFFGENRIFRANFTASFTKPFLTVFCFMKNLLLFSLLLLLSWSLTAQTYYVKSNASGANNGTSWQDAYTSLTDALTAASAGQVWVAAGTYKPAAANATFQLKAGVALYGGFNGTENNLSARNPVTNVTILNGDFAGNDTTGNYTVNRTDNALHVVEVVASANPADRATVDGFTISGGHTLVGTANPDLSRRGGGILTTAKLTVRNCRLTDNYGDTGGALAALDAAASSLDLYNCLFEKNGTALLGAGIYLRNLSGGSTIRRCIFSENKAIRGSLYVITSANMVVDSCQFLNNDAGNNPCSGMYTWQTTFNLTNSTFIGNRSNDYSGMYNDGREGVFPFTIDNCLFQDNVAIDPVNTGNTATGGAIFNATTTSTIKNCIFRDNAAHLGGAIYMSAYVGGNKNYIENCIFEDNRVAPGANTGAARGGGIYSVKGRYEVKDSKFLRGSAANTGAHIHHADSSLFLYKNCDFEGGSATFGGSSTNYNAGTLGSYEDCDFIGNSAVTSGGAASVGFTANITFKNCKVEGNSARFGGGLFMQNTNSKITVQDCNMSANSAIRTGGGINISAGGTLLVENTSFQTNSVGTPGSADTGIGGAMDISDDTFNVGNIMIRNSSFLYNFAKDQGAGLNISNYNTTLVNCLFAGNQNQSTTTGAGGAIINNASLTASPLTAINCTFTENVAPIGGGIAQWQDTSGGTATLILQNCILYGNLGKDYELEAGTPTVSSNGGNLNGDGTLAAVLTGTNDQLSADPLFVDPSSLDYRLLAGSPCINKGVAAGAPTTDLAGNPRVGIPDQGCYEFIPVGTSEPGETVLSLNLTPNPAVHHALIRLDDEWAGQVQVSVIGQNGAHVRAFTAYKTSGSWTQPVDVRDLPAGIYAVQVQSETKRYKGLLVKQ